MWRRLKHGGDAEPAGVKPRRSQVGMPRQFSIGTAMILTALFALLLGLLRTIGATPFMFAVASVFVVAIAACQAVLFGGRNPRKASVLAGAAMGLLLFARFAVLLLWREQGYRYFDPNGYAILGFMGVMSTLVGTLFGYVAGWFIAAVFLVRKEPADGRRP
jgi:uncharacterized protein YhhL (DUF1145 family)